jgi:Ras family
MPTLLLKYIIVGSSAVGKTCILAMFTEQQVRFTTVLFNCVLSHMLSVMIACYTGSALLELQQI